MNKSKGYLYYLIWIIGALLLVYYGNRFVSMMEQNSDSVLKVSYSLIGNILYGLALGAYLSMLGGLPNRRSFQRPLFFFVFLPTLLLVIYPILSIYFKMPYGSLYIQLTAQEGYFFITGLCGLTMMKSLFGSK